MEIVDQFQQQTSIQKESFDEYKEKNLASNFKLGN